MYVLHWTDVTRGRNLGYSNNLLATSQDVLLFYFTGHGGIDTQRGHLYELRDGRLFKAELLQAMRQHNPRLTVVLSDCCSTIFGNGQMSPQAKYASLPGAVKSDGKVPTVPT